MACVIPKVLHQVWIGPDPMPPKCVEFQKKFCQLHPTWEIRLFNNNALVSLERTDPVLRAMVAHGCDWALISDRLRIYLLWKYGGVYADVDAEPMRPLDLWIAQLTHPIAFAGGPPDLDVCIAEPNQSLFSACLSSNWTEKEFNRGNLVTKWLLAHDYDKCIELLPKDFAHSFVDSQSVCFLHRPHMLRSWCTPEQKATFECAKKQIIQNDPRRIRKS